MTQPEVSPDHLDAPAVRLVNDLVATAHRHRASDLHVEPQRTQLQIRWRIDGVLITGPVHPLTAHASLLARLKVLGDLNLVERRRPQDGQFRIRVDDRDIDVRLATLATVSGERAVLRLTEVQHQRRRLHELGLPDDVASRLRRALGAPSGMVICAGPTGAGKTTTLYAALGELDDGTRHLATIEDPVEHVIDGVTQIQVNEASGLTFSGGLRALLRHDPDVILVGEIRDRETAQVAVQAALSGHLVLSTLHATDAVSALLRLVDLGVDRYLVASAVTAVVAQRLVRRLCHDAGEYTPGEFRGRVGVFELMTTSEPLRRMLTDRVHGDELRLEAYRTGLRPLHLAADDLVHQGVTTQAEVIRHLHLDDTQARA